MNFARSIPYLFALLLSATFISAQPNPPQGFFTSEAIASVSGEDIIISIKKYNPTPEEIKRITKPTKDAPMSYLQLPAEAAGATMFGKDFESKLYCLDKNGNVKWDKTLGYSIHSAASPLIESHGFFYSGESMKDEDKVMIQKLDNAGKVLWQKTVDSLHGVSTIIIHENRLNALVSFDYSKRVDHPNGTYTFNNYPVYFFLQLNPQTGDILKKEYQAMGSYLSSKGFGHPFINSDYSYYLNNNDTAFFLTVMNQKTATVISEKMSPENKILTLTAGPESNHYLALLTKSNNKKAYTMISDFYGKKKKTKSELPVEYRDPRFSRYFILRNEGDSILSVISSHNEMSICFTDQEGKSELYKQIINPEILPVGAGIKASKPFIIGMLGRSKPGEIGTIKIFSY